MGTLVMVTVLVTGAVIGGHYVKIWLGRKSTSIVVAQQLETPKFDKAPDTKLSECALIPSRDILYLPNQATVNSDHI